MFSVAVLLVFSAVATAFPFGTNSTHGVNGPRKIGKRCTGEIQSLSDVAAAEECTTIVVGVFLFLSEYSSGSSCFIVVDRRIYGACWRWVNSGVSLTVTHCGSYRNLCTGPSRWRNRDINWCHHLCIRGKSAISSKDGNLYPDVCHFVRNGPAL